MLADFGPRLLGRPVDGCLIAFLERIQDGTGISYLNVQCITGNVQNWINREVQHHHILNGLFFNITSLLILTYFILLQFLFLSLVQGNSPFFRLDPLFFKLPAALLQLLLPQLPCLLLLLQPLGLFSS